MDVNEINNDFWDEIMEQAPIGSEKQYEWPGGRVGFVPSFNKMEKKDQLELVWNCVLKAVKPYEECFFRTGVRHIYDSLMAAYLSPLRFFMPAMGKSGPLSLDFEQFATLAWIFQGISNQRKNPMKHCPPEYYYFYAASRTPTWKIGERMSHGGKYFVINQLEYTAGDATTDMMDLACQLVRRNEFAVGDQDLPRFFLRMHSFRISRTLYDAWPEYWQSYFDALATGFGSLQVVAAVEALNLEERRALPKSEEFKIRQEGLREKTAEVGVSEVIEAELLPVVVPFVTAEVPEVPDSTKLGAVQAPCPCNNCGEDADDMILPVVGERHYVEVLRSIPVYKPDYCDSDEDVPMREVKAINSQECNHWGADNGQWDVFLLRSIWLSYLRVDAVFARYSAGKLYDRMLVPKVKMRIENDLLSFKQNKDVSLPRTFDKFAWLYWQCGLVSLDGHGRFPVGCKQLGQFNTALEISAAPFGNMVAAIESSLVGMFYYTIFRGEGHQDPPYLDKEGTLIKNLLSESNCNSGVKELTSALYKQWKGRDDPAIIKHALLVLDISLRRNSTTARSIKVYVSEQKSRVMTEFVDDAPLGRTEAMCDLLGYYMVLKEMFLQEKGWLIVKVYEFWHKDIMKLLYALFKDFAVVRMYRNYYSKPASKETYFVGQGYKRGEVSASYFYAEAYEFANQVVSIITTNLVRLAMTYSSEYPTKRVITCRKCLYELRTPSVSLTVVPVDVGSFGPPTATRVSQKLIIIGAVDAQQILVMMERGYCDIIQIKRIIDFFGANLARTVSKDVIKRALPYLNKGTEHIRFDEVVHVANETNSDWELALKILVENKGDITAAIMNLGKRR